MEFQPYNENLQSFLNLLEERGQPNPYWDLKVMGPLLLLVFTLLKFLQEQGPLLGTLSVSWSFLP